MWAPVYQVLYTLSDLILLDLFFAHIHPFLHGFQPIISLKFLLLPEFDFSNHHPNFAVHPRILTGIY